MLSTRQGSRRPRLEALEPRTVLAGDGAPPILSADFFGSTAEGTTDLATVTRLNDAEGGKFRLSWDIGADSTFGDGPGTIVADIAPGIDFEQFDPISWQDLIDLEVADTLGAGSASYPVVFRAEELDSSGTIVLETFLQNFQITIQNSAPTFVPASVTVTQSGSGCSGGPVTVAGSFLELGINDPVTVRIDWGDGPLGTSNFEYHTFVPPATNNAVVPFAISHTYVSPGNYNVTWAVWDEETTEFNIDPNNPAPDLNFPDRLNYEATAFSVAAGGGVQTVCLDGGVLTVNGSAGIDTVTVAAAGSNVQVSANFPNSPFIFAAGAVNQIVALLGDGDDTLINLTTKPLIAVGGAGVDFLADGGGRSILIGGAGSDVLSGGGGQDILIDSSTAHDANTAALLALLAEWDAGTPLATRINNIRFGIGVPALNGTTIANDGVFDLLIGGGGTDLILLHSGDLALGLFDVVIVV
jgi:RTX calcium-binding nonapeptide repeat (4 copies)